MDHNPALAIGAGILAFHQGLQRGRLRQRAYEAAVIEGRRQDAQVRAMRASARDLKAERARRVEAEARLIEDAIVKYL